MADRHLIGRPLPVGVVGVLAAAACGGPSVATDNRLACQRAEQATVAAVAAVRQQWVDRTATVADILPVLLKARDEVASAAAYAHPPVSDALSAEATTLGRLRVAISEQDTAGMTAQARTLAQQVAAVAAACGTATPTASVTSGGVAP